MFPCASVFHHKVQYEIFNQVFSHYVCTHLLLNTAAVLQPSNRPEPLTYGDLGIGCDVLGSLSGSGNGILDVGSQNGNELGYDSFLRVKPLS